MLSQLLLVSTEKIESPRLSTYMSLDCLGVRLELYLSGVHVYRDDLHHPPRVCFIRYQQKNSEYGRRLQRLKVLAHRHIIWSLESNLAFASDMKRCTNLPQEALRYRPNVVTKEKARDA